MLPVHFSLALADWDFVTFREMARIARTAGNHGIHRPMGNQLFTTKPAGWKDPWWATLLAPEWSHWDRDVLEKIGIKGFEFGIRYRSSACELLACLLPCLCERSDADF